MACEFQLRRLLIKRRSLALIKKKEVTQDASATEEERGTAYTGFRCRGSAFSVEIVV